MKRYLHTFNNAHKLISASTSLQRLCRPYDSMHKSLKFLAMIRWQQGHLSTSAQPLVVQNSESQMGAPIRKRLLLERSLKWKRNRPMNDVESGKWDTVVALCTADSYDMSRISHFFSTKPQPYHYVHADVIHLPPSAFKSNNLIQADGLVEAFIFSDGCLVVWAGTEVASSIADELKMLLSPFEIESLTYPERETLYYEERACNDRFSAIVRGETIHLSVPEGLSDGKALKAKMAYSNGLVDSVKLAVLEGRLERHIELYKDIPRLLSSAARLPLGRGKVLQMTGELLGYRAELNLHSELMETPDRYWSEPEMEEIYGRVSRCLDIRQRVRVLNTKLDCAQEMTDVLRLHLSERHSLKLEWGIITLIAVEVGFEIFHLLKG